MSRAEVVLEEPSEEEFRKKLVDAGFFLRGPVIVVTSDSDLVYQSPRQFLDEVIRRGRYMPPHERVVYFEEYRYGRCTVREYYAPTPYMWLVTRYDSCNGPLKPAHDLDRLTEEVEG